MIDEANLNLLGVFLFGSYFESYFEKEAKINFTKVYPEDLNSLRGELSNGGLRFAVAFLVRWQISFLCVSTEGPIQL